MDRHPNHDRVGVFYLEDELLISVLKGEFEIHGWPADAEVVSVNANWERRAMAVLIRSATFEAVAQGCLPPVLGRFGEIARRVETVMLPNGRQRHYLVTEAAERIDLPSGRVKFREFL